MAKEVIRMAVWQAFERQRDSRWRPLSDEQVAKRERGMREMGRGLFVEVVTKTDTDP